MPRRRDRKSAVKGFHGVVVTSDVEILTHDRHINVVGEISVEKTWDAAVCEHFFDLIGIWIRSRHDESGCQ